MAHKKLFSCQLKDYAFLTYRLKVNLFFHKRLSFIYEKVYSICTPASMVINISSMSTDKANLE